MSSRRWLTRWTELWLALLLLALPYWSAVAGAPMESVAVELEPALLIITLNGEALPDPVIALRGAGGTIYLQRQLLDSWRISARSATTTQFDGQVFVRVDTLPGVSPTFEGATQSLSLDVDENRFGLQQFDASSASDMPMTQAATGFYADYDVIAEMSGGTARASGAFDIGFFSRHGVFNANFVARAGDGDAEVVRLDTAWTSDRPESMMSIRIGDSISRGGSGAAPVRFGGIQIGRNFATQPGFVTIPLPTARGSAAVPSVVDIYVNDALRESREIQSGPFEFRGIPAQTGDGTVRVVVRDLLGRETVNEFAYYASSVQLRRGLHDYSLEIGALRKNFGERSNDYGPLMAMTTHRYGLSDNLTAEGHLQLSEDVQMGGVGLVHSSFDLGELSGTVSASRSRGATGARVEAAYQRPSRGFSFGVRGELTSRNYRFIGAAHEPPPRYTAQAFVRTPIPGGTISANVIHRSLRGESDQTIIGANASLQIGRRLSGQLFALHTIAGRAETAIGLGLGLMLGERHSGSSSLEYRGGRATASASLQRNSPIGEGHGYRIAASAGDRTTLDASYLQNLRLASPRWVRR